MNDPGKEPTTKQLGGCTGRGFMPGQSGNPAGRPKGPSLTRLLREALDRDDSKLAGEVVEAIIRRARNGDLRAIKLIFDRVDGPVPKSTGELVPRVEVGVSEDDLTKVMVHLSEMGRTG